MASKKTKKQLKKEKKVAKQTQSKAIHSEVKKSSFNLKNLGTGLVILLITGLCFLPSLNNYYVNWDDDRNFYDHKLIKSINDDNFGEVSVEIFKTDVIGNYNPLTTWTFAVEQKLFKEQSTRAFMRHFLNLILHLGCTLFVFFIGLRLKLGYIGSIVLALLFGIHPMRVESVAWVTERKDVLFGFFYLAALYYYIRGKQNGFKVATHVLIGIFFVLSLFAKIQAVLLPVSMILVDYYLSKDARIALKNIWTKIPYFIGSVIIGLVNLSFLSKNGSLEEQAFEGPIRMFIGSYTLIVYYIKSLIPFRLSPLYPYPSSLDWSFYVSIISFVLTAFLLWKAYKSKWKVIFFGLSFFIANVVLLLQILPAGQGFLADRFTYIAYMGLFFIFAYYLNQQISLKQSLKIPLLALTTVVLAVYGFMTFQQNKVWKDSDTMWTHVLKYYKRSTLPWNNRANHFRDIRQTSKALSDYSEVIKLEPKGAGPYNSRARLYFNFDNRDSLQKALWNYNKAIEFDPQNAEYIVNRGATYAKMGDPANSIKNLNLAETIKPEFKNIYLNRSVVYNQQGDYTNALKDINSYLKLDSSSADMWYEKARIHNYQSSPADGLKAINEAIKRDGRKGLYYFERAKSNYLMGNYPSAKQDVNSSKNLGFKADPGTVNKIMSAQ